MKNKKINTISIIGISSCIFGVWKFFSVFSALVYTIKNFPESSQQLGVFPTILMIVYPFVFMAFIVGGILFLLSKKSGRLIILYPLAIDICLRIWGIYNYWHTWFTMEKPIIIPEGHHVVRISMIPSYIILAIEILALYLINRKKLKENLK